jgi:peptide/nickel transport system permease protein
MSSSRRIGFALALVIALLAMLGPFLSPNAFDALGAPLAAPSRAHWFGTDPFGRDVFARLAHGARISLLVATLAIVIGGTIGICLGVLAGGRSGWMARVLSRFIDLALALPRVVVLLVLVTVTGTLGPFSLGLVLGATGWPAIARLARGEALRLAHAQHVAAATALGASPLRVLWHEILPGTLPAALVALTLGVADVLLLEAGLSFLGIGIRPPAPTWGGMILESQSYLANAPWLLIAPSAALVAATAAATLLGDALRRRLQPHEQ